MRTLKACASASLLVAYVLSVCVRRDDLPLASDAAAVGKDEIICLALRPSIGEPGWLVSGYDLAIKVSGVPFQRHVDREKAGKPSVL